jgi:cell division protease FtsH
VKLIELAEILMEKEVIFEENLKKIFGARPFEKEAEPKKVEKTVSEKENVVKKDPDDEITEESPK